jgi:AhpD family alkylhydroperoxidase
MDQRTRPAPRLAPLPPEHSPELAGHFETTRKRMGFIPNSILIMQRSPKMVRGFTEMSAAIWDPQGKVDLKLKRLISHVASRSAGCKYCMAHTAEGAVKVGVDQRKLDAVWSY